MEREIELVDEFVSTPIGNPQIDDDVVSVSSTVTDGEVTLTGRIRVGVGPFGVGVFIGVIASDEFLSEFVAAGASIESSIKFTEATLPQPKVVAFEWDFLSGAAVTNSYSNTGISYSETLRIDLCTDGTYKRRFSGGDVDFTFFDDEVGEWSVSGTRDEGQLVMYSTEGKTREIFPMAYQDDGLFTVGDRDYDRARHRLM